MFATEILDMLISFPTSPRSRLYVEPSPTLMHLSGPKSGFQETQKTKSRSTAGAGQNAPAVTLSSEHTAPSRCTAATAAKTKHAFGVSSCMIDLVDFVLGPRPNCGFKFVIW